MDGTIIRLDGQIWPLPATARRVTRLGKNCAEAGRRANPREVAEGKGHRLWVAAAWAAEVRGQEGQPREQERIRRS